MGTPIIYFAVGYHGSGKTTAAHYLREQYDFAHIERSTVLGAARDESGNSHIEMRSWRENILSRLGKFALEDMVVGAVLQEMSIATKSRFIITGNRSLEEIHYTYGELAHAFSAAKIIAFSVDPARLFDRCVKRARNPSDYSMTSVEFNAMIEREQQAGILDIFAASDYTINNNGRIDDLFQALDRVVAEG